MPFETITQTVPRRLHSTQTECEAYLRPAAMQEGGDHLEQLVLVDRTAMQLEVHVDMRGRWR